jgi:NAD(P)-dependent dehydrogenase (short-subunit alcohol dehydrogenase family)
MALAAKAAGWSVLGTVRKDADAAALEALGLATARLDLGQPEGLAASAQALLTWCEGRLDAVIHNAGSTWPGPLELQPMADIRQQFQVNTFGHIELTQHLLPALRAARGRLIFVSSDSVTTAPPLMGAYGASKRALEGFAESLAQEVADQGVSVCILAPGPYATAIWGTSTPRGEAVLESADPRVALYRELGEKIRKAALSRPMNDPAELGALTVRLLEARHPPLRTVAPFASRAQGTLKRWLGDRLFHKVFRWGIERRGRP